MTEQRELEMKYGELIERRGKLKGLEHKAELKSTQEEIISVSKRLKESTRTLCRVLKDNPDVDGNRKKIQLDREDLQKCLKELSEEVKDLQFSKFKAFLESEREKQGQLEKLNSQIIVLKNEKKLTQDNYQAAEAAAKKNQEENLADISKLNKALNEAKTDSELELVYLKDNYDGVEDYQKRQHRRVEKEMIDKIKHLTEQKQKENAVSVQICEYLEKKQNALREECDEWEVKRSEETEDLES